MTSSNQAWIRASVRRWVGWLVLASLFAVACVYLSNWQLGRRDEAVARVNVVIENYDKTPIALGELVENGYRPELQWRQVTLTGTYLPNAIFLVRNRPYAGAPGFIQIGAFKASDGKVYAIDRGWLATGSNQDSPDLMPTLPSGQLQVTGRIRPTEPTLNRNAPAGQLATVNSAEMAKQLAKDPDVGEDLDVEESFYLRMSAESVGSELYPTQMAKPKLDEGNHLSYAIQWIVFGAMAFFALVWAIRQERLAYRAVTDPSYRPRVRKKVGDEDKSFEDAL